MSVAQEDIFPRRGLPWVAQVHLVGIALAGVLTLQGAVSLPALQARPLLAALALGAALEAALLISLRGGRAARLPARTRAYLIYGQLALDIAGMTLLLHLAGGRENPFFPFYVFPVILAAVLLTRAAGLGFATLASLLYGGLLASEALGWLPHYSLVGLPDGTANSLGVLGGLWLALSVLCFLAAESTTLLIGALRRRANELAHSQRNAEARADELRNLNEQLSAANTDYQHNRRHLDELYAELQQAYNRLEIRSRNMSELNEQLRAANAECKARREELTTVYAQMQEAYNRLEIRTENMRELNEQLRAANAECSRQRGELTTLNKRLAEANTRLSELDDARSQFTLLVTHELRAPVAAIQSYLKLILEGYVKPEQIQETLQKAERRAMEQLALIADLLELGRLQSADVRSQVEPVRLERALAEQVDMMSARAQERGLTVQVEVGPDLPPVLANPAQVRSLWSNLISNAIKYNRDGGEIRISLQDGGDRLLGTVSDTGIGVPPEAMSRLFSEFFRADNAKAATRMGTGLGLAIVKETIERAGGEITAESELDKGTTFRFWLPAMAQPGAEPAEAHQAA